MKENDFYKKRFSICKDLVEQMKYLLENTTDKNYRKYIKTAISLIEKSTFEF